MSLTFKHPFTAMIVGPTSCSKTRFVFKLVDHVDSMIEPPPTIVYCYGEYQQLFRQYPQVDFREWLPDMGNFDGREIVDDLIHETNEIVANLLTKGSHHRNVSVVFLVQNLFPKKKTNLQEQ